MGFVPEPRTYRLIFTDPALNGLEVRAKSVSVDEFLAMDTFEAELAGLGDALVEWNLGPDGKPLPCTLASLRKQEPWVVRAMIRAWLEAISAVPPPLDENSGDGQPSAEESTLQLASQSRSLAS
jgi:hypothetical protein